MMKNSLSKMNASWETTAMLMGDSWIKTIVRVVTPNAVSTLLEVFSYYFVNAMVTVSAVIFIAGARTMVITTKIKELQYFNEFNEIFVLSLLILFTNLIARALFQKLAERSRRKENITDMKKKVRKNRVQESCSIHTGSSSGSDRLRPDRMRRRFFRGSGDHLFQRRRGSNHGNGECAGQEWI